MDISSDITSISSLQKDRYGLEAALASTSLFDLQGKTVHVRAGKYQGHELSLGALRSIFSRKKAQAAERPLQPQEIIEFRARVTSVSVHCRYDDRGKVQQSQVVAFVDCPRVNGYILQCIALEPDVFKLRTLSNEEDQGIPSESFIVLEIKPIS